MAGIITPRLEDDGSVTVDMGAPVLEPARVPFDAAAWTACRKAATPCGRSRCRERGADRPCWCRSCRWAIRTRCRWWTTSTRAPVQETGPQIEHHPRFPKRVNAGFLQVLDRRHVKLRVFERGAGETLACGTGACAAVVAGIRRGLLDSPVQVEARGGRLTIAWAGEGAAGLPERPGRDRVRRRNRALSAAALSAARRASSGGQAIVERPPRRRIRFRQQGAQAVQALAVIAFRPARPAIDVLEHGAPCGRATGAPARFRPAPGGAGCGRSWRGYRSPGNGRGRRA